MMMVVTCQNCSATLTINEWQRPLTYETRDSDPFWPRSFLIVGAGWVIHRCAIAEVTTIT